MALPTTNLSINDVAQEFGGVQPHALNEYYKGGAYVVSTVNTPNIPLTGTISLQNFGGQQNRVTIPLDISASTYNYNVATSAQAHPNYIAGLSDVVVTVQSGVYVGSTSTATYAMTIPSTLNTQDTVKLVNNGTILGCGGAGGAGGNGTNGSPGGQAGRAIYVSRQITIQNNGIIAAGGGGGGGGGAGIPNKGSNITGGGGGGGAGYTGGAAGGGNPAGSIGGLILGGAGGSGGGAGGGGAGGAQGAVGTVGVTTNGGGGTRTGGAGGGGNYYLVGSSYVTWMAYGTLKGFIL